MFKTVVIEPRAKPRQTQKDKWINPPRPCVQRYRDYADQLRKFDLNVEWDGLSMKFYLPMPRSWSKKKRAEMLGRRHLQKPDLNNLVKSFEDILLKDDSAVWHYGDIKKLWGRTGGISVNCKDV